MTLTERVDPARAWVVAAVGAVLVLAAGAAAFPRLVWDRFLWRYFWGPVYADAHNARCAVVDGGAPELLYDAAACQRAAASSAVVAEPGYTLVSEAGYALTLIFMLVGVLYLLRALDVGGDRGLFFALVPFTFFGGALRVVEDANDAVPQGVEQAIAYPWNALLISPVIYFTVFALTLAALVAAVALERRGAVEHYERLLAAAGTALAAATVGYLALLGVTREHVSFYPQVTVVTLVGATLAAAAVWVALERFAPALNRGTGYVGLVVIWGHAVDGVANLVAADWLDPLGVPLEYGPKHPVNRFLIRATEALQPQWLSDLVGTSWTFLVVKLVAAVAVVWVFDEQIFEESPRYAILLLVAILAVGLGPGTRDMLRATFGI